VADQGKLPAGIMPDYYSQLPDLLRRYYGRWVWHQVTGSGLITHVADDGTQCLTVRVQLPPAAFLSVKSLRVLAGFIRRYALVGRRTSRQGFEIVGVDPARLEALLAELAAAGFMVGGTGNSLHQLKGCTGYLHCQNAAIDPPSIMKVLADYFYGSILQANYPARLKISVGGCPNQCGAGLEADIGILGVFLDYPQVDDQKIIASGVSIEFLINWCPTNAIKPKETARGLSVEIRQEMCIRCTSCVLASQEGIMMGQVKGAAIVAGGRGGSLKEGSCLGQVVFPFVPAVPLAYGDLVAKVLAIVQYWSLNALPGERMDNLIARIGWEEFLTMTNKAQLG
jgi:sulfite reductase beta subunit